MTAIVAIICSTSVLLAIISGAFKERERRFLEEQRFADLRDHSARCVDAANRAIAAAEESRKKLAELETQLSFMRGRS